MAWFRVFSFCSAEERIVHTGWAQAKVRYPEEFQGLRENKGGCVGSKAANESRRIPEICLESGVSRAVGKPGVEEKLEAGEEGWFGATADTGARSAPCVPCTLCMYLHTASKICNARHCGNVEVFSVALVL